MKGFGGQEVEYYWTLLGLLSHNHTCTHNSISQCHTFARHIRTDIYDVNSKLETFGHTTSASGTHSIYIVFFYGFDFGMNVPSFSDWKHRHLLLFKTVHKMASHFFWSKEECSKH